ncbi:MAG: MotA/TolQ/ExbB proton channel family protein [Bdellovibrionaceae bacterium]|nr:MotA/TolQ/ExbB proton channel family protein [Pseudobdellovibrionaceae bacterium]
MEFIASMSEAFVKGGFWMWVILGLQLGSYAIIIERTIFLYRKSKIGQRKLVDNYEKDIRTGRLNEVKDAAQKTEEPVGQVVAAGVEAAINWGGKDEIRGKMDEVLLDTNSQYEKRTNFLAMLANVATLTGLLGTITGMIKSFTAVSTASPMEKAVLLSSGISEAMNTTAYGLIVAIPALVAFAILANRGNQLSEDLNQASLKVYNWLSYSYDPAERAVGIDAPKKPKAQTVDA